LIFAGIDEAFREAERQLKIVARTQKGFIRSEFGDFKEVRVTPYYYV
jgi:hypothetical protein